MRTRATHRAHRTGLRAAAAAGLLVLATTLATAAPAGATAPAEDDWLGWVNLYRAQAGLPAVAEDPVLSAGAQAHADWVVANTHVSHAECDEADSCDTPLIMPTTIFGAGVTPHPRAGLPALGSTQAGNAAGRNGNVAGFVTPHTTQELLEQWISAPFHALGILDPRLLTTGFGIAQDPGAPAGYVESAGTLDILQGLSPAAAPSSTFPVGWPASGAVAPLSSFDVPETPDPLASCPGYARPAGLPVIVQLASGTPVALEATTFEHLTGTGPLDVATPLEHCAFDGSDTATGYVDPASAAIQANGRAVLAFRGAVVIIPKDPLVVGERYRYSVEADGVRFEATFTAGTPATAAAPGDGPFPDVPLTHVFVDEIDWVAAEGIAGGYADGTYGPGLPVSRQAMAAFLWRQAGEPVEACPEEFPDVPASHGFRAPICWLLGEGITTGYDDGRFHPTNPVSRQAAAAFLWRLADEPVVACPTELTDVPLVHRFRDAICWALAEGITTGYEDGTFRDTTPVSRQAMAAFLYRYVAATG